MTRWWLRRHGRRCGQIIATERRGRTWWVPVYACPRDHIRFRRMTTTTPRRLTA